MKKFLSPLILVCLFVIWQRLPTDVPNLAAEVAPAVVAVECVAPLPDGAERQFGGSATVVSPDGLLVTNYHVVAGASSIFVTFYNGEKVAARLVGADKSIDVAVLSVARRGLPSLAIGDADRLIMGQQVISVGNGHGLGSGGDLSVTVGIVSALNRAVMDAVWFETDAGVYPGCSGGPVCDMDGKVVGINVAASSRMKGFFIPFNARVRQSIGEISGGRINVSASSGMNDFFSGRVR